MNHGLNQSLEGVDSRQYFLGGAREAVINAGRCTTSAPPTSTLPAHPSKHNNIFKTSLKCFGKCYCDVIMYGFKNVIKHFDATYNILKTF